MGCLCPCGDIPLVHGGFVNLFEHGNGGGAGEPLYGPLQQMSVKEALLRSFDEAIEFFKKQRKPYPSVYLTGHSMGGSLACLTAFTLKKRRSVNPTVFCFGMPRLGNDAFVQ